MTLRGSTTNRGKAGGAVVVIASGMEPEDDAGWDSFVAASAYGHLMQSRSWGGLKARFGWDVERVTLMEGGSIVAGAQVLYRSLPFGLGKLAYVPMGPVVDWGNEAQVDALLTALQGAAKQRSAFCLKVEPDLLDGAGRVSRLLSHRFQPSRQSVQWKSTILIDLDCPEDAIMARFSKDHRQKIRKASRAGVVIRVGTTADLPVFSALLTQTARRKEFAAYPPEYYEASYTLLAHDGQGRLLLATLGNSVLAGLMVFRLGMKAYCMFAASGNVHREVMSTYLLHWEAIRWAREHGCTVYDFCGIPDEVGHALDPEVDEARHDGLWGVYRFKRGFGGHVATYPGAHDRVYSRPSYFLYNHSVGFLRNRLGATWNRKLFSG